MTNDKRPREWWADKSLFEASGHLQHRVWASDFERPGTVRIINYSAYEQAIAERDKMAKMYNDLFYKFMLAQNDILQLQECLVEVTKRWDGLKTKSVDD